MIVETKDANNGYHLNSRNFRAVPHGRIRIARYTSAFWPEIGLGYYGDIYLRKFIRVWKRKTSVLKHRRLEKWHVLLLGRNTILFPHVLREIGSYL